MDIQFSIKVLGNGSASPHPDRLPSAHWVKFRSNYWLMDCGEGVQYKMSAMGLNRSKLDGICITHMHADHYLGVFGLLSSMSLDNRTRKLILIAPSELKEMIKIFLLQNENQLSFEIDFIETDSIEDKVQVYEDKHFSIEAFPLLHRIHTCGFKFNYYRKFFKLDSKKLEEFEVPEEEFKNLSEGLDIKDSIGQTIPNSFFATETVWAKSYAYCSDTSYFSDIAEYVKGVDLLYHEATFDQEKIDRALQTMHSTAQQAGRVAKAARAKLLIIGHFSSRYKTTDILLKEAKAEFKKTAIAMQGKEFAF